MSQKKILYGFIGMLGIIVLVTIVLPVLAPHRQQSEKSQKSQMSFPEPVTNQVELIEHLDLEDVRDERINALPDKIPKISKIPKIIWQTYISKQLPPSARAYQKTWLDQIPADFQYHLFDDQEIYDYIHSSKVLAEFPGIIQCWNVLPIGVMKADLWRYCVLYFEGGIYSDIDTVLIQPRLFQIIRESPARMIVGLEFEKPNSQCFCQWTMISEARHPILKTCLNLIIDRSRNGIDTTKAHFVHEFTGPTIWTHAINLSLGLPATFNSIQTTNYLKNFPEKNHLGLQIVRSAFFMYEVVQHQFSSIFSKDPEYHRWKDDVFYD